MRLDFTKMHGLGNDFIVLDAPASQALPPAATWRRLADRHTGIGFDQALVLQAPTRPGTAVHYRIFNADGGEVEQCGNGARCFVKFVRDRGLTDKREIRVETAGGVIAPKLEDDGEVTVDMGVPRFAAADVPFSGGSGGVTDALDVDGATITISALSMGNPHAVQVVDDVEAAPVTTLARSVPDAVFG